jgi:2-dehydro-3-deoxyphosphogluconate aldolase / (4S)-4-hydroxy-2-oxoglutarate aldolase
VSTPSGPRAEVVRRIKDGAVIAVVRAASAAEAVQVAQAAKAGGVRIIEVTLTVPDALQAITQLAGSLGPDALVGAGSVLDAQAARACIQAGARFVVSPILKLGIVAACREHDVAVMPGALTPNEIAAAAAAGADLVKVFPVSALGGASYIRALRAPMPHVELVPTGGVTLSDAAAYLQAGAAAIGAGSDLAGPEVLRKSGRAGVTAAARAYVEAVRAARRPSGPG